MWRCFLAMGLFACGSERPKPDEAELCTGCDTCSYEEIPVRSAQHVAGGIDYDDPPPAGGDHDPCWAPFGIHDEEVPDENFVHNLEHGGVVFLYGCTDCPDEIRQLGDLVRDVPRGTAILTPYAALPTRFGAVAWQHRLLLDCFDSETFRTFYDAFVDQAPESVTADPSAACMD